MTAVTPIDLLAYHCFRCDNTRPVSFSEAGPHTKASCGYCKSYVKFIPMGEVPFYVDNKKRIWELSKDVEFITKLKIESRPNGDFDALLGLQKNIAYHNLYLLLINRAFT